MSTALATVPSYTPSDWQIMREQADTLLKSGFLPQSITRAESAVAIIMQGRELGIPPMAALQTINVIQGKPTVSPQLMLALINRSGQLEDISIETGPQGAVVTMKRRGRASYTAVFGPVEAQAMGLSGKHNYKAQAPTMFKWRAVADAARTVFPDVVLGLYTPDEMGADVDAETGVMVAPAPLRPVAVPHADVTVEAEPVDAEDAKPAEVEVIAQAGETSQPQPETARPMSKEEMAREKRAQGMAAMGLVSREGDGFKVATPSLRGQRAVYEVRRNELKNVVCTCTEFQKQAPEDPGFRCEHILAVKHALLSKNVIGQAEQRPAEQPAPAPEPIPLISEVRDHPRAKDESDAVTQPQLTHINQYADKAGVDAEGECGRVLKGQLSDLSRRAATAFIGHLKEGAPDTPR